MPIIEELHTELVDAMKTKDAARRDVIRQIQTEITQRAAETSGDRDNIDDETAQAVIVSYVKKMRKAADEYRRLGGRGADMATKLEYEIGYLGRWLPQTADENTTRHIVEATISELGVAGDKTATGRVIGAVMKNHDGLDGALVARLVRETL